MEKSLIRRISIDRFNRNISFYLAKIRNNGEIYFVTHRGKTFMAMLPIGFFDNLVGKEVK